MTLPAAVAEHLGKVRAAYLAHFKQQIDEAVERTAGKVLAEPTLAVSGERAEHRVDLVIEQPDGSIERQFIVAPSTTPWAHSEHPIGDRRLLVDETVWFAFTVIAQPVPADTAFVQTWFRQWFDDADAVEGVAPPFQGRVHFCEVETFDDGYRIDVDLGSAPVRAVEELVAACVAHGAQNVWLMSGADALAARFDVETVDVDAADDDDDDGDMFELPDELLEHLAAVRHDYLDAYVARLRQTDTRVALEAGAGTKQGELALRVDFVEVSETGEMTPHDVGAARALPWDEGHYDLAELRLYVMQMVWPSMVVVAWPAPPDTGFITTWYRRWIEQGFAVEEPFGGYVHMLSDIRRAEDHISFLVDLGSAPVEAVRDLVAQLAAHGVTTVSIGSGEQALSGATLPT